MIRQCKNSWIEHYDFQQDLFFPTHSVLTIIELFHTKLGVSCKISHVRLIPILWSPLLKKWYHKVLAWDMYLQNTKPPTILGQWATITSVSVTKVRPKTGQSMCWTQLFHAFRSASRKMNEAHRDAQRKKNCAWAKSLKTAQFQFLNDKQVPNMCVFFWLIWNLTRGYRPNNRKKASLDEHPTAAGSQTRSVFIHFERSNWSKAS